MTSLKKRALQSVFYFGGLLVMTLGIAISIKSGLGVSPTSAIPYTMSIVLGMDMGLATTVFSFFCALLEIPILRKDYKIANFLQIPVSVVFGVFMSACTMLVEGLPAVNSFAVRFVLMLISTVIIAAGVFSYVSSGFVPLPAEGVLVAIAQKTKFSFATLKLIGDVGMVVVSLAVCLIVMGQWGSIGIGTIVSAFLVGAEMKILAKHFGEKISKLLA